MNRLKLLDGPFALSAFSFLCQALQNFLLTRSLTAAVILALGSRLLGGTLFSWLFPS